MSCASSAKIYSSLTLSCEERFPSSYTAEVTQTSVFGNSDQTGTAIVTFTPDFDALNGFGIEYVPVMSLGINFFLAPPATIANIEHVLSLDDFYEQSLCIHNRSDRDCDNQFKFKHHSGLRIQWQRE
jgi:hypothetical protein